MLPVEGEAIWERTSWIYYLFEYLLAIFFVSSEVTELLKKDAESDYQFRIFLIVLVPDTVRLLIIALVASSVPVRRMRQRGESTTSYINSAFQLRQLILICIVVCIGIFLPTWHAVSLFSQHRGLSSFLMLLTLLSLNLFLVVVHVAVISCAIFTHRRRPLGHVAKPASQLATFLMEDKSHDSPCAICLCDLEVGAYVTQLRCKHLFHTQCIVPWAAKSQRCPLRCPEAIEAALCTALV